MENKWQIKTFLTIDVWQGWDGKFWNYKVSLGGKIVLACGNNYDTRDAAYTTAAIAAAEYKAQWEVGA